MYYGAGFNLFGYNSNVIFSTQKGKGPPNTTLFANFCLHIPQDSLASVYGNGLLTHFFFLDDCVAQFNELHLCSHNVCQLSADLLLQSFCRHEKYNSIAKMTSVGQFTLLVYITYDSASDVH
jgi:hypothetical protein